MGRQEIEEKGSSGNTMESSSETSSEENEEISDWTKERFGMDCEGYKWGQTVHSVEIFIRKEEGKSGKSYEIKFTPETLLVKLKGAETPILEGRLWQKIKVDQCLWMIEDDEDIYDGKPYIYIYLYKWTKRELGTGKDASAGWWRSLLEPGPYLQSGQAPSAYYLTRDKKRALE